MKGWYGIPKIEYRVIYIDLDLVAVKHILVHPIECLQGALIRGGSAVLILGRVVSVTYDECLQFDALQ